MQKKFLRTVAISIVFIGVLGTIGITNAYGMYDEAFKRDLVQSNHTNTYVRYACDRGGKRKHDTILLGGQRVPVAEKEKTSEKNRKNSPYETIGSARTERDTIEGLVCSQCNRNMEDKRWNVPTVDFTGLPHILWMNIKYLNEKCDLEMCPNPSLTPELQHIWDSVGFNKDVRISLEEGLNRLWSAARSEDRKNGESPKGWIMADDGKPVRQNSDRTYEVRVEVRKSPDDCCCTIL